MKKITSYILSIFCVFAMVSFFACGEKSNLSLSQNYVEMSIGDEFDISSILSLENIDAEDVSFTSLDQNVVTVENGVLTAVGAGTTFVEVSFEKLVDNLEVKVLGEPLKLNKVTGLMYDKNASKIVWNDVLVNQNGQVTKANAYTIKIRDSQNAVKEQIVYTNSFEFKEVGNYFVSVKANDNIQNGDVIYYGSDYCDEINLEILSAPKDITYNDETNTLSWASDETVSSFKVVVNGLYSDIVSTNSYSLDLAPKSIAAQTVYSVQVISTQSDVENKILVEGKSEVKTYTRLYAPTISIQNGLVTWDNSQTGDFHYELTYQSPNGTNNKVTVTGGEYELKNIPQGIYSLSLSAIGDEETYLSSQQPSTLTNVEKLEAPVLLFDYKTKTLSVVDYLDKNIELQITYGSETNSTALENGQYVFEDLLPGTYTVCARTLAKEGELQLTSDLSNNLNIIQLEQVDLLGITQSVVEGKYHVDFEKQSDLTYSLSYFDGEHEYELNLENGAYGNVDEIFDEAKNYVVTITASNPNSNNSTYYLSSNTQINVERQKDIVPTDQKQDNNNHIITWEMLSYASGYDYIITKDGENFLSGQTNLTTLELKNLEYGHYKVQVKALGANIAGKLYLDSLNYGSYEFDVTYGLLAPQITFDRETLVASIQKVENATIYEAKLNDEDVVLNIGEDVLTVDLADKLTQSGSYTFTVVAKNENELILDSSMSSINIVKHEAPNKFNISTSGIVSIITDVLDEQLAEQKFEIKIGDEVTNQIGELSEYVVLGKLIATDKVLNNTYYLDSDYSTFKIQRVQTPNAPVLDETTLKWDKIELPNFKYTLLFRQNEVSAKIEKDTTSIDVLSDEISKNHIDASKDFDVTLTYTFTGALVEVNADTVVYFTSNESQIATVRKIKSDLLMKVSESDGVVLATWQASDVLDVNYELSLDDVALSTQKTTSYDITSHVTEPKDYTLKLKISKPGYISSEYVVVHVTRLEGVNEISVDEEENITVDTLYSVGTELEQIKITSDGEDISNLSQKTGKFDVKVKLIAKVYESGEHYYLDSAESTFSFERMNTPLKPTIDASGLLSYQEIGEIQNYMLKISNGQDSETFISNQSQIYIDDENILNIIDKLGGYDFTASVRVYVEPFDILAGQSHYLSSYYSEAVDIHKLLAPQEISISASGDDFTQNDILISWTYNFDGADVYGFEIKLVKGASTTTYQSVGQNLQFIIQDATQSGEYYVLIKALGENNYIDSVDTKSNTFTRLNAPTNLTITQNAVLSFTGTNIASGYIVVYTNNAGISGQLEVNDTTVDLSKQFYSQAFSGQVFVSVYAKGDRDSIFTSPQSSALTVTKASDGEITLYTDRLKAGTDTEDTLQYDYIIKITQDDRVVKELVLEYGDEYVYEDFKYQDTNTSVDTSVDKDYVVTLTRRVNQPNYILSDSSTFTFTKLATLKNLGFLKLQEGVDELVYFSADVSPNATQYNLTVNGNVIENIVLSTQYVRLAINEQIYSLLNDSFTFEIYAKGLIDSTGSGKNYINSSVSTIKGKVLPKVTGFAVSNGELVWDKVEEATDYAINIDATQILTGYVENGVHTLKEDLQGKSGEFVLDIKAIGNIKTTLVTTDVVLDSQYSEELTVTKLEKIDTLAVTNGYISFAELDQNNLVYVGIISGNSYILERVRQDDTQQAFSTFYSEDMYNDFSNDTVYTLTVKVLTSTENTLYSDESNSIKVKLLNNNTVGSLKLTLKKVNDIYDYTQSYLVWTDTVQQQYGYDLQIDGKSYPVFNKEFLLDTEEERLSAGQHTASVSVFGSGEQDSDGVYSLKSKPAEVLVFTKLDTPTPSLLDGKLSWADIANAGGYLLYLDGKLVVQTSEIGVPVRGNTYFYDIGDITDDLLYKKYEVQAVPSAGTNFIASTKGVYTNDDGTEKEIRKLSPPDTLKVKDGSLKWDITLDTFGEGMGAISNILGFLSGSYTLDHPFTMSMASLQDNLRDMITLKLTGTNGTYEYIDHAAYYCIIDQSLLDLADIPQEVLDLLKYYGWPSINNNYIDFGSDIPAGFYNLSLNQLGNSDNQLTSNFGSTIPVYIPFAPVLELVYTNNSYVLRWNKVTIPSQYYSDEVKYIVYGIKETINEYDEKIIDRVILTDEQGITATEFNITELIENGTIDENFTSFAVYVRGDDNMVLNGKISNSITVSVLEDSEAYVRNGEVYWNPQQSASSYVVTYIEAGTQTEASVVTTEAYWNANELSSDVAYYDIYIQAIGDRNTTTTNVILTGPNTFVGRLKKLASPSPVVENGIFYWANIENSSSYKVYITQNGQSQPDVVDIYDTKEADGRISYISTVTGQDISYDFVAMGDLDVKLSQDTTAYVNSNHSESVYATLVPTVQGVVATDGELVWDKLVNTYNNAQINYYRIILQKIDSNGTPLDSEIIISGDYSSISDKAVYSCQGLDAGKYSVRISGYFLTSDNLGKYQYNGETAYYLLGIPSEVYTFEKYATVVGYDDSGLVDNIVIKDGVLSWTYSGNMENRNYDYELRFATPNKTFTKVTQDETYSGAIVEQLIVPGTIELSIRVVARQGFEGQGYINSEYLDFVNVNHSNSPYIYQLDGIDDSQIRLGTIEQSEELHIIWDSYTPSANSQVANIDVKYLVTYYTGLDEEKRTIVVDTPYISTAEFNYSISDSYTLYYTITVLPLGDESYVASYESNTREIQKPESVKEVTYNATEMYFTWATDGTSQDHVFRIKDELLLVDENGDIVYKDGVAVVLRTYTFTTLDNTTNRYYPVEMGTHKVSVAVVLKNSTGVDGSLTSDYTYYYDALLEPQNQFVGTAVTINLFKVTTTSQNVYGGMGTTENPYLIETAQHFANILYRLNKPEYENSYTLSEGDQDRHITLSESDRYFHFKQVANLTDVAPLGANDILNFTAIYDGDQHSISWKYDLKNISTSTEARQYVALFGTIDAKAVVKNVRVYLSLQTDTVIGSTVSLLAFENYGVIDNIVLGEQGSKLSIESRYTISVYGVAFANHGEITNIINYYDIDLKNTTSSVATLANYALVGTNNGTLDMVANYGDIYLQTTRTTSAGIVATNRGSIERAVFTGNVTLNIAKDSQGIIGFVFGGIVGTNTSGTISFAYTKSNIVVARSARASGNENVRIAGLVGSSNNGDITSSYVSVNISATTTVGVTGDLALFIANVTTVSSTTQTVTRFANSSNEYSAVLGTSATNFPVETYSQVPSGQALNTQNKAYFTVNENDFPILVFENQLKANWGL